MVYLDDENGRKGLGRMLVNIFDKDLKLVAKVLSEADGYYNYIGLMPGNYTIQIDASQLSSLALASKQELKFTIKGNKEGDIVNSLNLFIRPMSKQVVK
jgi:hypothetical protein